MRKLFSVLALLVPAALAIAGLGSSTYASARR